MSVVDKENKRKRINCDEVETFKAKTTQNPADEYDEMAV